PGARAHVGPVRLDGAACSCQSRNCELSRTRRIRSAWSISALKTTTHPTGLTYRVTAVQNCYVAFADNSMRRIDQFTQDDIAAGRMLFVHTAFGSFNFYVQDSSGRQSQQYQFYATTQPLSIIMRSRLPSLEAFPNLMHILSPDHLLAVTNNGYYARDIVYRIKGNGALGRLGIVTRNPTGAMTLEATREFTQSQSEQIVYRVRRSPTFGQLRINSRACLPFPRAPEEPTCEFSQADVNAGQVVYLHLGNNGSLDSFYFCVSDSFSQPEHKPFCQTFEIHVSPRNFNPCPAKRVLQRSSRPDLVYSDTRTPEYGQLYRDKLGVFNFSQADVDKGLIRYQLTRFVSSLDSMQFSVVTKSRSAVLPDRQLVIRVRAGISVSPVILHECPGEMQTSRLTRNHIDDRELKNKLRYEAPTRYRIVKQAVNALISPASFTQSDIDAGAVQAVGLVARALSNTGVAAAKIEVTTPLANVAPGAFNLTVRLVLCQGQNASEARGKEFTNSEDDAARVLGLSRTNFVTLVLVCGVVLLAAVLLVLVRVIPQRLAKAAAANGRCQADSQVVEKPDTSQLYGSGSNGGSCNGGATLSSSSSRMQALPIVPNPYSSQSRSSGYYDTRSLASNHSHNASYRSIPGAKSASISNLSPGQQHLQAQLTPPPTTPPPRATCADNFYSHASRGIRPASESGEPEPAGQFTTSRRRSFKQVIVTVSRKSPSIETIALTATAL
uniref:Cadherin domain-containing protein n=1 Tax=Macrostomum lignano TaxID=282301 RepID=A0A1I8F0Q6_9PLAT